MARRQRKRRRAPARRKTRPEKRDAATAKHQIDFDLARRYEEAGNLTQARLIYQQVLQESPAQPTANLRLATILHDQGEFFEAADYWRAAIKADAGDPFVRFNYGTCLRQLDRYEEAVRQFEDGLRLARSGPSRYPNAAISQAHLRFAQIFEDIGEAEMAVRHLRKATQLNPKSKEAFHKLGYNLRLLGDLEAAKDCFRQSIKIDPDYATAHRSLAVSKNHTEYDEDVAAMESLFRSDRMENEEKIKLAFGLGKVFEDLGEYDQAFNYWQIGNDLHNRLHPCELNVDIANFKALKKIFNKRHIEKVASRASIDITPIFIVSMPRAGSSLAEQILACHSKVYGAGEVLTMRKVCENAVKRFPADLAQLTNDDWQRLGQEYLDQVSERSDGQPYITDKLPGNYQHIGIIRVMFPAARIIHCRRDPMDTALSCYKTYFEAGAVPFSYDLKNLGTIYRHYEKLMAHWHKLLPGWIYDLDYEHLTSDSEECVRHLLDFIGLPFEEGCLAFHESKRVTRTASATQVHQPIYRDSINKWKHFERGLLPFQKARKGSFFGA